MVSNTRLYGAAIALVSGVYSLWSASMASRMVTSAWLMGLLGVVVIVHGAVLVTDYAAPGDASGPLMVVYAVVMLLLQALLGAGMMDHGGMDGGMGGGMGGSPMTGGMGWDAGMAALAVLMLVSGLVMTRDDQSRRGPDRM